MHMHTAHNNITNRSLTECDRGGLPAGEAAACHDTEGVDHVLYQYVYDTVVELKRECLPRLGEGGRDGELSHVVVVDGEGVV